MPILLAALADPAHARTVVCFGDSTSWLYPHALEHMRPDWHVVSGARPGDVSSSQARLSALLETHRPEVVVIMIGTNDVVLGRDGRPVVSRDPAVTAANVRVLAHTARRAGSRVLLLTQTPAACGRDCPVRQAHTREVAHRLVAWGLRRPPGITVADLRDELTVHPWHELSDDGLHPNAAGATFIATFVATRLDDAGRSRRPRARRTSPR